MKIGVGLPASIPGVSGDVVLEWVAAYGEAVSGWQETVTTYRTNLVPRSCSPKSKAYSKSPRLNYSS